MSTQRWIATISSPMTRFVVGFGIPTVILFTLSSPERLGAMWAMVLSLAFPVALELLNICFRQRPSWISLAAIVGIIAVGLISIMELNVVWLAIRRSIIYAVAAIVIVTVIQFKPNYIERGLDHLLEMKDVRAVSRKNKTEAELFRYTRRAGLLLSQLLLIAAIVSYLLTILFVTAPTGSSLFNTQYAELRILSIFVITLPLVVLCTTILVYLVGRFEKLTGIKSEDLIKKSTRATKKK